MTTFANLSLKHIIPQYDPSKPLTKKELQKNILEIVRKDPEQYVKTFEQAQELGNAFSTNEGATVGLDDITPQYQERAAIFDQARRDLSRSRDKNKRIKAILTAQDRMKQLTFNHPGEMADMVRSGGRGSPAQFMKAVNSPVAVTDSEDKTIPYLIDRSYAEGLSPLQNWLANEEARRNAIKSNLATSVPGELSKVMSNATANIVVGSEDCGTKNGVLINTSDPSALGRFQAGTNTVLTHDLLRAKQKTSRQIRVRSPLTCEAQGGVCQHCMGKSLHGGMHEIGENVGIKAAQTLSEPMTQMVVGSKHGASVVTGSSLEPRGVEAVKQLLEVPKIFKGRAVVARTSGTIDSISQAPQGGSFLHIKNKKHYIPPDFSVRVRPKDTVSAGDVLTDGMPNPQDIIKHKGLGAGREYLVNKLQDIYKDSGFNIDRRHFEVVAKNAMNHVRVHDPGPELPFYPGEVVNYNRLKSELQNTAEDVPLNKAVNRTLAKPVKQHLAGTKITPEILKDLRKEDTLPVVGRDPKIENIMLPIPRVPLFNPDWLQRLGHREIKSTLTTAAQFGESSKLHGFNPIPPLVTGEILTDKEGIY